MTRLFAISSILLIFLCQTAYNQSRIDSLQHQLQNTAESKQRVDLLNSLAELNSSDSVITESIALSKKLDYENGLSSAFRILSNKLTNEGDYDSALALNLINLDIQKSKPSSELASTYSAIGLLYDYMGDYKNAMDNFVEGLKVSEEINDKKHISNFYNRIGIIHNYQGNYDKTIEFFNKSLELRKEIGDKRAQADIYNNLGIIYRKQNDVSRAIEYYTISLNIKIDLNDNYGIASSYNNLGTAYFFKDDYNKALEYYSKSLAIKLKSDTPGELASTYINIGETYTYLDRYNLALNNIETGLNIAKKMGNRDDIKLGYEELSQTYAKMRQFDSAYKYHLLYNDLKDSIFSKESEQHIIEIQTKYDLEKKEKEIVLLQKENEIKHIETENSNLIRNIFIFGFVIISFLIIAIIRSYKDDLVKNRQLSLNKKDIESQNEVLKTMSYEKDQLMKIVAHDLRSPLNQIDGLVNLVNYSPENLND